VELCAVEVVEHPGCRDEDDAARSLAGLVGEGASEEGLAGATHADEERVDALGEKGEVVQREGEPRQNPSGDPGEPTFSIFAIDPVMGLLPSSRLDPYT
jgi:hypothetical protein